MAIIDTIRSDGYDMASWMWISFECLVIYDRPLLYKQRGAFCSLNRNQWTIASLCATGNGTASHSFSFFNLLSLAFVRMTRPYCSIDLLWQVLLLFFIQIYMLHIRSSFLFLFRLFGLESYLGQRGGCGLVGWRYVFFYGYPCCGHHNHKRNWLQQNISNLIKQIYENSPRFLLWWLHLQTQMACNFKWIV